MYKSWETIGQFLKVFSPCNKMLFIYFFSAALYRFITVSKKAHSYVDFTRSAFT